jgi:hypothetical protein
MDNRAGLLGFLRLVTCKAQAVEVQTVLTPLIQAPAQREPPAVRAAQAVAQQGLAAVLEALAEMAQAHFTAALAVVRQVTLVTAVLVAWVLLAELQQALPALVEAQEVAPLVLVVGPGLLAAV